METRMTEKAYVAASNLAYIISARKSVECGLLMRDDQSAKRRQILRLLDDLEADLRHEITIETPPAPAENTPDRSEV